jgi:two-component system response regulator VicR
LNKKILVVDDEKNIVDIIAFNLNKEGYDVIYAYDGKTGLELALNENPDLVLLDLMMPGLDGYEVCKAIRQKSQIPIIMLTARAEEVDKVLGLELGADDFVTKPFGLRELMARVRANLRRSEPAAREAEAQVLDFGGLTINLGKYEVRRNGEPLDLTTREYELIKFLAINRGQVFTREELLERVWGYEHYGDVRTVDVTVRRLRTKVEENPDTPAFVVTKRGVGYYFEDNK